MIKRTLYFGNPCYLRKKDLQLRIEYPEESGQASKTIPIEDVGIVVLDNPHITISHALISELAENNAAIISCDGKHLPFGLMLPIFSHHAFTEKLQQQISCSVPLKKNLWQQTVVAKIANQAALLRQRGTCDKKLQFLLKKVKSGDPENVEGRAAAYYWDHIFGSDAFFVRHRFGEMPNALLNYGYAILLAIVARSLTASGLVPALGIHHRNKYNPWCLASDIMEPFRPYVDKVVIDVAEKFPDEYELTTEIKRELLQIPAMDITIEGKSSPLMVGVQRTTASLSACFAGTARKLIYPELN